MITVRLRLGAVAILAASVARGQSAPPERWIATWAASLLASAPRPPADSVDRVMVIANRTLRQVIRVSAGGSRVRIKLSNQYGDRPLVIGSAHVALRTSGAAIDPATDRAVTFNGRSSVVIRAGAYLVSDPIALALPQLSDLAVSLFIADSARLSTRHALGLQTNYLANGNSAAAASFAPDTTVRFFSFLAGVDVVNPALTGVIVTLGNSITDGAASVADSNGRWPDVLARRLLTSREPPKAVVNAGVSGNRVLSSGAGPSALERFDRDVLMQPGATHIIVLEGVNDINNGGTNAPNPLNEISIEELIAGHQQLIDRAHERGVLIFGATLTPIGGMRGMTPERLAKRDALNAWIRTSGAYDGVIDFDKATRDPADTTRFLPAYDSGDHLHPSPAGLKVMGEAVDLSLFRKARP